MPNLKVTAEEPISPEGLSVTKSEPMLSVVSNDLIRAVRETSSDVLYSIDQGVKANQTTGIGGVDALLTAGRGAVGGLEGLLVAPSLQLLSEGYKSNFAMLGSGMQQLANYVSDRPLNFAEAYMQEMEDLTKGTSPLSMITTEGGKTGPTLYHAATRTYQPTTDIGKALNEGLMDVISTALSYVGNKVYEEGIPIPSIVPFGTVKVGKGEPLVAAGAETLVAGVAAALGVKGKAKPALDNMARTKSNIEAANVGGIRLSRDTSALDAADRKISEQLKLTKEQRESIDLKSKIRLWVDKFPGHDAIPATERSRFVNSFYDDLVDIDGMYTDIPRNEYGGKVPLLAATAIGRKQAGMIEWDTSIRSTLKERAKKIVEEYPALKTTQVTDRDGDPLTVYHGTRKPTLFTKFDPEQSAYDAKIISFSFDPEFASDWSGFTPSTMKIWQDQTPPARIIPAYIISKKPFDFRNNDHIEGMRGFFAAHPGQVDMLLKDKGLLPHWETGSSGAFTKSLIDMAKTGSWSMLESRPAISFYKTHDYDSFMTRERDSLHIHVFSDEQVVPAFDPFKKQKGMWTPFAQKGGKPEPLIGDKTAYQALVNAHRQSQEAEKAAIEASAKNLRSHIRDLVVDPTSSLRGKLEATNPTLGKRAILDLVSLGKSTSRAHQRFQEANSQIYTSKQKIGPYEHESALPAEDLSNLDMLINARRNATILSYRPSHKTPLKTRENYEQAIQSMRDALGDEKMDDLVSRSNQYFASYRDVLDDYLSAGLIDEKSYIKLAKFDYSPIQYVDMIDPIRTYKVGEKSIVTVRDSGIEFLEGGRDRPQQMDSRRLLIESISRFENRKARNIANNSLYEYMQATPTSSSFIKEAKVNKEGVVPHTGEWTPIYFFRDGEKKAMLMSPQAADGWVQRPRWADDVIVRFFHVASGSALTKTLATGANPAFVPAGLSMDLLHVWLSDEANSFSPHLPIYLFQMASQLGKVAPDVLSNTGRIHDAPELEFSTLAKYSGGPFRVRPTVAEDIVDTKATKTLKAMSWLNNKAEQLVRFAHREQMIEAGIDPRTATNMAIDRLNFSEGGMLTKALESGMPYTSVGVQAIRTVGRYMKDNPGLAAYKVAQLMAPYWAWQLYQMVNNPTAWQQTPTWDKINNYITHYSLPFRTGQGDVKYPYFTFKIDQVLTPFTAAITALNEQLVFGKTPDDLIGKAIQSATPGPLSFDQVPVPIFKAITAYSSNYDIMTGRRIWSGMDVKPEDEVKLDISPYGKVQQPTNQLAVAVGKTLGMSPERLQGAVRQVIPSNFWLSGGMDLWKLITGNMNEYEKQQTAKEALSANPLVHKVYHLTSPVHEERPAIQGASQAENSRIKEQKDKVGNLVYQMRAGDVSRETISTWVRSQPPEDQMRLKREFNAAYGVSEIFERFPQRLDTPSRNWWMEVAKAPSKARGQEFYEEWKKASPGSRDQMTSMANALTHPKYGLQFRDSQFMFEFRKLRESRGD